MIIEYVICDGYCFGMDEYEATYYAMSNDGQLEYQDSNGAWYHDEGINHAKFIYDGGATKGDIVRMIFNVSQRALRFIKNGEDVGDAYSDVDTSKIYSMAIVIRDEKDDFVELLDFCVRYK